jgi:general nucleoside transport system permease protein
VQSLTKLRGAGYNALALAVGIISGLALVFATGGDLRAASTTLLLSPISSTYSFAEIFVRLTVLLIMGLGIALGLRAGVWNVGAEGQYIVGSVMAMIAAMYLTSIPPPLVLVIMMLAGAGGGLLWMIVPAVLKARFGANEIIVTLLLNLVASNFLLYALDGPIRAKGSGGYLISDVLPADLRIPKLIPLTRLGYGVIIALGLVVVFYLLSERTSFGLQVRTVGRNRDAARYAGISIPRVIIMTMLLAGATAGLAGAVHVSGVIYALDPGYPSGYGFIAIIVAMLGGTSVIGTTIAAFVMSYFIVGAEAMQSAAGVPFALVYTIEGIILFSLAAGQYLMSRGRK